jgi:hypothetical protein
MNKNPINALLLSRKIAAGLFASAILLQSCSSSDGSPRIKDFEEQTVNESTQGVITELEEIEPGDDWKIVDERVIEDKDKSLAIVHTLEGETDTLSLKKMQSPRDSSVHRHSGLRGILMYSMARSFFSNNMNNVTPESRYYKNSDAYKKSLGVRSQLQNTSVAKTVKVPSGASRGYGSGKSFRSFGG